tara:strand:+ start:84158 stop:84844 length:687 start_codon:yes stop_codon:yes gene_type:complete
MQEKRGGKQIIPRPDSWSEGEAAPWSNISNPQFTIESITRTFTGNTPDDSSVDSYDRESSVLIALYEFKEQVWMILTRRSETMRFHTSEVSFPGGNQEPQDNDPWDTALREAHEEIGLDPTLPKKIGQLTSFVTVGSNSLVTPFVATLPYPPELKANTVEVEKILHIPLYELLSDEVYREEIWVLRDGKIRSINFFEIVGDTIWGATGSMIREFLTKLIRIQDTQELT